MIRNVLFLPALASILSLVHSPAQCKDLIILDHVPPNANALLVIDAERLYESPLARSEEWSKQHAEGREAGGIHLPAGTQQLISASSVDFRHLRPAWQAVVVRMDSPPKLNVIAEKTGGHIDMIGITPTVMLPHDASLIEFDDHTVGILAPANRQRASQWLDYRGQSNRFRSPFLEGVAEHIHSAKPQVIIGLDLQGFLSKEFVALALSATSDGDVAKQDAEKMTAHAAQLAGLETCLFGANVDKQITGTLRLTFHELLTVKPDQLKHLVSTVLEDSRIEIADFATWKPTIIGSTAEFTGQLTSDELRRIVGILESPTNWLVDSQRTNQLVDLDSGEATG